MVELSGHDKAVLNCIFNPSLPLTDAYEEELNQTLTDCVDETPEMENVKDMEVQAVNSAEAGNLQEAVEVLKKAIEIAPEKASLYNNRAQVFLLRNLEIDALNDLTKAIELGMNNQKKTLCQALCQRGLIYRKSEKIDQAKEDFEQAAKLGSHFAKSQLIELNPYAALCNQMLRKVMNELK